jgi:hypothetical protein
MKKLSIYSLVIVVCMAACSQSTTEITGSWKSAQIGSEAISSILVTALTSKTNARQTVEDDLANALQKHGYNVVKSMNVMPPTFTKEKEPNREALLEKIKGTDVDAIITVALIDKETENRYVPGSYGYAPMTRFGYYGNFWGYYNNWYPTLYSPGYYNSDKVYFLETNLYDAETQELLWSAQSETYNPSSLSKFSKDFADVMLAKMEKDGALKKLSDKPLAKEKD